MGLLKRIFGKEPQEKPPKKSLTESEEYKNLVAHKRWTNDEISKRIRKFSEEVESYHAMSYLYDYQFRFIHNIGYDGLAAVLDLVTTLSYEGKGRDVSGYRILNHRAKDVFETWEYGEIPLDDEGTFGRKRNKRLTDIVDEIVGLRPEQCEGILKKELRKYHATRLFLENGELPALENLNWDEHNQLAVATIRFHTELAKASGLPLRDAAGDYFHVVLESLGKSSHVVQTSLEHGSADDIIQGYALCLQLAKDVSAKYVGGKLFHRLPEYFKAGIRGDQLEEVGDVIRGLSAQPEGDAYYRKETIKGKQREVFDKNFWLYINSCAIEAIPKFYERGGIDLVRNFVEAYRKLESTKWRSGQDLAEKAPTLFDQLGADSYHFFVDIYRSLVTSGKDSQATNLLRKNPDEIKEICATVLEYAS